MSLTSPNCPSAQELPVMVQNAVSTVPGVGEVDVRVHSGYAISVYIAL
jgi:metal-sulfur cluster biosynthetic enzyme